MLFFFVKKNMVSGWWLSPTPLKNDGVKVSWDDDIPIYEMEQTTFSKTPTRVPILLSVWKQHTCLDVDTTVDGRNPAPVDRWFIPSFLGFQPSKVVQDFFHPQYVYQISPNAFESSWAANIKNKVYNRIHSGMLISTFLGWILTPNSAFFRGFDLWIRARTAGDHASGSLKKWIISIN